MSRVEAIEAVRDGRSDHAKEPVVLPIWSYKGAMGTGEPDEGLTAREPARDEGTSETNLARGTWVQRYVVLHPLGRGGMGTVYAAYDTELDRRVALKLLRVRGDGAEAEEWRARMLREGKAMARLSHPNVVTLFDMGLSSDGRIFLAMELVDGGTLRDWLEASRRDWRAIVSLFCEVGEGLAAAHGMGVIHRDFKLDNVLVGKDGRPRVTDFGVARGVEEITPERRDARSLVQTSERFSLAPSGPPSWRSSPSGSMARLTLTGALMGTPGYMAPEQYASEEGVDARADVFAFSATLYRALYGERAFAGRTVEEIGRATRGGEVREAPKGSEVPGWVRRVVLWGLSPSRVDRPGTMGEILSALRSDPAKRRARAWAWGLGLASVAAVGVGVRASSARRARECVSFGDRVEGAWNGERRAWVERAFAGTGLSYGADTALRVEAGLDAYASSWRRSAESSCVATRVKGEQSEPMLELRTGCLDERLDELHALVEVLGNANAQTVEKAVSSVEGLPSLSTCADVDRLSAAGRLPRDAGERAEIRELSREVARARDLNYAAGAPVQSRELLARLGPRVEATRYGPLLVSWSLGRAFSADPADPGGTTRAYESAIETAEKYRLDAEKAHAECAFGLYQGEDLGHFAEAHRGFHLAAATLDRFGGDEKLEALCDTWEAWVFLRENRYGDARALFERGIALYERAHEQDRLVVADAHAGLAFPLVAEQRFDEGIAEARLAARLAADALGDRNPRVAVLRGDLGANLIDAGRLDEALATCQGVLATLETMGEHGQYVAGTSANTGLALLRLGRAREAIAPLTRARALCRADGNATVLVTAGVDLAEALRVLGRRGEARNVLDEMTTFAAEGTETPPETAASILAVRAKLALDEGSSSAGLTLADEAVRVMEKAQPQVYELADARLVLSRALVLQGREPDRAKDLAARARDGFAKLNDRTRTDDAATLLATLR